MTLPEGKRLVELRVKVAACLAELDELIKETLTPTAVPMSERPKVHIDWLNRVLTYDGAMISLTDTHWRIFRTLAAERGKPIHYERIEMVLWGSAGARRRPADPGIAIRMHIANLRKVLPFVIQTNSGAGWSIHGIPDEFVPARRPTGETVIGKAA